MQKDGIVVLQKRLVSEILRMDSVDQFAHDSGGRKMIKERVSRQETAFWKDKLEQLREALQLDQVMDRLKISYDMLAYDAQQIFLDIACFFIGTNKEMPSYMWSDCKLYPMSNINILVQISMIKVGNEDEFQMHDQLRDMGREIVRQEDVEYPWMRSRIWSTEEAFEAMSNKKGSNRVKAIRVDTPSSSSSSELRSEYFSNLPDLKYLDTGSLALTGDFNNLLPNLRWLQLERPDTTEDRPLYNFTMNKMVILDLGNCRLKNDWGGWSQMKTADRLKYLDISGWEHLNTIPYLPKSLEVLNIRNLFNKQEVLNINELQNLKKLLLNMSIFKDIKGTFGKLKDLQSLNLAAFWCNNLKEGISDIGELPSLEFLYVSKLKKLELWWTKIRRRRSTSGESKALLPSSLTDFHVEGGGLSFKKDEELVWLPSTLENLENLTRLSLHGCPNLVEIQGIEGLKSLESLELEEVSGLTSIQQGLEHLIISSSSCSSCKLHISIINCPDITQVLSFDNDEMTTMVIDSLQQLHIHGCPRLDVAPLVRSLSKFPRLGVLKLDLGKNSSSNGNVVEEKDLEALGSLEELDELRLENFPSSIKRMPSLSKLRKLSTLEILSAPCLQEIPELGELRSLTLLNCPSLERLWPTDQQPPWLKRLKSVWIRNCSKLTANEKLISTLKAIVPDESIVLEEDENSIRE
ncbi:Disease resistance protein L6 [Linum perenne]